MSPFTDLTSGQFAERLFGQSFVVILLVVGIYIVGKMLIASNNNVMKTHELRVQDLKERLDNHREHFKEVDQRLKQCEDDRRVLWEKMKQGNVGV